MISGTDPMVVTRVIIRCWLLLAVFVSSLAQADAMDDILDVDQSGAE